MVSLDLRLSMKEGFDVRARRLAAIENSNVRDVALRADEEVRNRMLRDSTYRVNSTYSEAYGGESA